jgi:hypothetical protein
MGMKSKKKAVAKRMASKKMDTTGFMSVEDVKKAKKAGTFKDWTEKYNKK